MSGDLATVFWKLLAAKLARKRRFWAPLDSSRVLETAFWALETRFWEPLDGSGSLETAFLRLLSGKFRKTRVLRKSWFYLGKTMIFEDLGASAAVKLALEQRFWGPLDVKLPLERRFWRPFGVSGP